ncbi:sigma-54-dependent transcriptional regulator [Candidatus Nitrospira bockiana]
MSWSILYVDDERSVREAFSLRLADQGFVVDTAGSGDEALSKIQASAPDVVILDLVMPKMSGIEVLVRIRQIEPTVPVILLTARGTVRDAVEAMRLGAYDFIAKSIELDDLLLSLRRATEFLAVSRRLHHQTGQEAERYGLDRLIANSPAMQALVQQVREVARNERVTVLLQGETGCGKQFLARVIHWNSPRAQQACIEVDCPSIPCDLFESELFGYEKGAFSGAAVRKPGLIELADGGTVLFDEIGDLPLPLQTKLLRVIEERSVRRVGGTATIPVDVRFMAATNRDLKQAVAKGEFREDLYFRLNVVTLTVPPLRERREDLLPLAEQCLVRSALALRKPARMLSEAARDVLLRYAFPGNIRELTNLIERAVLFSPGAVVDASAFPADLQPGTAHQSVLASDATGSRPPNADPDEIHMHFRLGEHTLAEIEDLIIQEVLKRTGGNKSQAAKYLGITRWMLDRRRQKDSHFPSPPP